MLPVSTFAAARFFGRAPTVALASAAALLVFAAGCATYQPQPLSPEKAAAAFDARSLDDPALREFMRTHGAADLAANWPPASWDLRALTLAAWFHHPEMEVAQAKLATAEAALITAGARPNPTLGFSPTFDADPVGGVSPWTLGFALDWPIETAGRRSLRLAQARHAANRARLGVSETAWQVRSRVRQSLASLESAMRSGRILARHAAVRDEVVALFEARLKAGESSSTEVQLVRVSAARSALDLEEAEKQTTAARIQLADALGLAPRALANVHLDFAALDALPDAQQAGAVRREAVLNRADVLGALSVYDASETALQLEIAKQFPDLRLGPGYAWDRGENKFTLGLSLTLPVFNRNRGPIAEAGARRREAAANFDAVQARAIGEVELTFANYRDARAKLETADALLRQQQERTKSIQQSFAAGALDRLELVQSQAELGTSELARAAAFAEAQLALGALEDAMQHGVGAADVSTPASVLELKPINR